LPDATVFTDSQNFTYPATFSYPTVSTNTSNVEPFSSMGIPYINPEGIGIGFTQSSFGWPNLTPLAPNATLGSGL
ncbi:MAG: hypothetical protein ACO20H_09115, partial [Bacteriovoracaceae bacterium]